MADKAQYCTELWKDVGDSDTAIETNLGSEVTVDQSQKHADCCSGQRGLDPWYNCMLQRLANMETDYRNDIIG